MEESEKEELRNIAKEYIKHTKYTSIKELERYYFNMRIFVNPYQIRNILLSLKKNNLLEKITKNSYKSLIMN